MNTTKYPNIVLEGIGGSGKTTISNYIQSLYNDFKQPFILQHFQYPYGQNIDEKYGYQRGQFALCLEWMNKINQNGISMIYDRSWIGEYLWSNLYRGREPEYLKDLEKTNINDNTLIIYVYARPEVVVQRLRSRGKDITIDDPYFSDSTRTPEQIVEDLNRDFIAAVEKSEFYKQYPYNFIMIDASEQFDNNTKNFIKNILLIGK